MGSDLWIPEFLVRQQTLTARQLDELVEVRLAQRLSEPLLIGLAHICRSAPAIELGEQEVLVHAELKIAAAARVFDHIAAVPAERADDEVAAAGWKLAGK